MVIRKNEFHIASKADGLLLSGVMLVPEGRPHGVVQIVHGMSEHKERYLPFMTYLAENGWIAVIHDNRGHGKSVKKEEELGYFYDGGYKALIDDIEQVRAYVEEGLNEELPYILVGHSMGSLAVRCYLQKYDENIDKLIVLGSPSKPAVYKTGYALTKLMLKLKGGHAHSKLLDMGFMGSYAKKFEADGTKSSWICSDPEVVRAYIDDPLCGFPFTVNGYWNLIRLTGLTYRKKPYQVQHPDLPILFLSGREDPCHLGPKNFGKSVHFMKRLGYRNVQAGLYAGMRHEVLWEKKKKKVYQDILKFIEA